MTFVGKIFTVLVFIFSICFMIMASMVLATHTNWFEKVNLKQEQVTGGKKLGMKYQIVQLNERIDELQTEKIALDKRLNALRVSKLIALAQVEEERHRLDTTLKSTKVVLATTQAENVKVNETIVGVQEDAAGLASKNATLRIELAKLQSDRDKVFNQFVAKTDEFHQLQLADKRLKETNTRLAQQLASMRRTLVNLNVDPDNPVPEVPVLEAIVTGFSKRSPKEIYVGLSVGKDDGIQEGHEFNVTRGSKFVGRVRVMRVYPDRCVALSIPEFYKHPFAKNDKARTITPELPLFGQAAR